jgi:hypothetical protein
MANEYMVKRTAFAHLVHPGHASASANSSNTGVQVPAGAIVTGIKMFTGGAVTGGASLSNAPIQISAGAEALLTNNVVLSAKMLQTRAMTLALVTADAKHVSAGGELKVEYVSTGTAATGVTADFDIYVDYLYTSAHD